jgi:phosphatidylinositol alpha-mannosyltransferase
VVVENLVSTMAWVAVVVAVGLFLPLSQTIWITTLVIGFICLTIIGVALLRSPGRHMPPWLSTGPLWHRATRAFARLWGAVRESHIGLRNPRQLAAITLPSVASWGAQLVGIYCALRAFGLEVVGWSGAGLLLVTVTVAQIFPILPGNVGVFQAAVVVPITHSYPVSSASALAFAVGLQATEIVVGVVIGFLFLMVEGVSFRQLRMEAEAETEGHHTDVSMADTLAGP